MKELTEKQKKVLKEAQEYIEEEGISPTVRELQSRLGYSSSRAVQKHLDALERKGAIQRTPNTARSIRIEKTIR